MTKPNRVRCISAAAFSSVLMAFGSIALADEQIVSISPSAPAFGESDTSIVLSIDYATNPANEGATGLGVKIFYDNTLLSADDLALNEALGGQPQIAGISADTNDDDNDPTTNEKIIVAWLQKNTTGLSPEPIPWPETDHTDGVKLYDLTFGRKDADFTGKTTINFRLDTAAGFDAKADSVEVIFKDDETAPEITLSETSVTIEAVGPTTSEDNSTEFSDFVATITVTDNKDSDISTDSINAFLTDDDGELVEAPEGFAPGVYEVTLIAKDSSGNSSDPAVVTITVQDSKGPLISGVADLDLAAVDASGTPSAGLLSASASDLVDGVVSIVYSVGDSEVPASYPLGSTEVTVTASDSSGNASTATFTVTVADKANPVIVSADGVTLEATGSNGYSGTVDDVIAAIAVTDNVDASPIVALAEGVEGNFALGSTDVGVTVTDAAGNVTTGTVPVTVVDTTAPSFSGANQLVLTVDTEVPVASSDERVSAWLAGVSATDLVSGETEVSNSTLPAEFPVGSTTITFTSTDTANNTATKEVIVLVAVGPSVTVADSITVVSIDGEAVPATQPQISAFIGSVTAADFSGNVLDVTNDAPDAFALGETVVTFTAVDADDRQGQNSSSVTVIAASGDNDTDGDGIDDLFEVENSLDPNDADDGEADADGDGRSNLDEYLEGKDPNADDVAPVVTAPADVLANSEGTLTSVDLGEATATDALDGELTPVADNPGPYASGAYTVTWSATDAAGNAGSATQTVVVTPQVSTQPKGRAAEGGTFMLKVNLNGAPPAYPVEIPFTLGGTAEVGVDYTADAEAVVITEGRSGMVTFSIASDEVEEGTEVIEVTLGDPAANAVLGAASMAMVSIIETAEPPSLKLSVNQGDKSGRRVSAIDGNVMVMLTITDPNGTHEVDWSNTDENLVRASEDDPMMFEFDPEALSGGYAVIAAVTDSGIEGETFSIDLQVLVEAEAVEADSDGDGIVDSKDTSDEANVIAVDADSSDAAVTADEGVTLVIGDAALANGTSGIAITEETIAASGQDGGAAPTNGSDEDYDYPLGVYDFQVQDLPVPGQSARIVIPLGTGVPADAEARKYTEATGWKAFVVDDNNAVATAAGSGDGACPGVGSELYVAGLTEGDTCLQLTLQDGGPNDADGEVNGEIDDPSGIAAPAPVMVVDVGSEAYQNRKKVGGGCSVGEGPGDFGLVLLAMLAGLGMLRKRMLRAV